VGDTLAGLLPWGVSILLHAGLVLLALFIVWRTVVAVEDEEAIIPQLVRSDNPTREMQSMETTTVSQAPSQALQPVPTEVQADPSDLISEISIEPMVMGVQGASGSPAPFGLGVGDGAGMGVDFFGGGGNARNIAFVVDASGSLIDTLPFVIQELRDTINQLDPDQRFAIIFFQNGEAIEAEPRGLTPATDAFKQAALRWIDMDAHNVTAGGATTPLPAIRQALRYQPDLLYILSDNITGYGQWFIPPDQLISEIEDLNNNGRTVINTIQFLERDPITSSGEPATLERISEATGGEYVFVSRRSLNLE
jgi:hypothetical protein